MLGKNGTRLCSTPGCTARVHARTLCRACYDEERYLRETRRDPEAEEEYRRELQIEAALEHGPHSRSPIRSEEELREAWESRKDAMIARYESPPYVALRPAAWWALEAGRPELAHAPSEAFDFSRSSAERERASHEFKVEQIRYLAGGNHLSDREADQLVSEGRAARSRIGTLAEQKAFNSPDWGGDKLTAALGAVVTEALSKGHSRSV